MSVTFVVDGDLAPPSGPCDTRPLGDTLGAVLALGGDAALAVVDHGACVPLIGAVHRAFAEHRALVLSPDAMWLTIAQGVAQHVRLHADELRSRLVRHAGKKKLTITRTEMPRDAQGWRGAVDDFRELLAGELGDGRARLLECDFSTTTDVERTASRVVLMDAVSPYFRYEMTCVCGIPEITLTGTVDDWKKIRAKIEVIAELDLARWCQSLRVMADHWVRAAEGHADPAFWKAIYKPKNAYGGSLVSGWIARMVPYIEWEGALDRPNPLLDVAIDAVRVADGMPLDRFPATRSSVDVDVEDPSGARATICLEAGVLAVAQDLAGRLVPTVGWLVRPALPRIDDVIDRLRAVGEVYPPMLMEGPAEVIAIFRRIGGARFHGWTLHGPRSVVLDGRPYCNVKVVIDLPDGTQIGQARGTWVHGRIVEGASPDELTVIGDSLAALIARALDTGGAIPEGNGTLGARLRDLHTRLPSTQR